MSEEKPPLQQQSDIDTEILYCSQTLNVVPQQLKSRLSMTDESTLDAAERKKLKRKEYKKKQKERMRQTKQKPSQQQFILYTIRSLIRDIYQLKIDFNKAKQILLNLDTTHVSQEIIHHCLQKAIETQLDLVRSEVVKVLHDNRDLPEDNAQSVLGKVFDPMFRAIVASREVQQLLQYCLQQEQNTKRSLDVMAMKYLIDDSICRKKMFRILTQHIKNSNQASYIKQRQVLHIIDEALMLSESDEDDLDDDIDYDNQTNQTFLQFYSDSNISASHPIATLLSKKFEIS